MYLNRRLLAFVAGARLTLVLAIMLGLLASAAGVGRLALSGYAIALVWQGAPAYQTVLALAGVVAAVLLRAAFQYGKEMTGHRAATEIQISLRHRLYAQALALGPGVLGQRRTGDLLVSLVEGVDQLESFYGEYLPHVVVAALTIVGIFVFMVFVDAHTALVFLGFALVTLAVPGALHRRTATASLQRRQAYGDLSAEFLDSVQGLATLKAFGQSRARGLVLAAHARQVFHSTMNVLLANAATGGLTWLGISAGAGVALGWGALRVSHGSLDLAPLLVVVMLGVEVFRPLRELTTLYHRGMLGLASAAAVFDLLDSQPNVKDPEPRPDTPARLAPTLEFDNVSFGYPGRQASALKGVSFRLAPGESLGVVGRSGAGKSTLIWLALRFFDPDQGCIRLGGHDLRQLPLATIRRHVAVVTQDTYLFHGTVAENLRLGKPEATPAELEDAARTANALEFIRDLPRGFDTVIGERGVRLSGGQRQRIAIARALLKNAPILLLDEALSSVDAENESVIQQALNRLMEGRTTLTIAHRLSSVIQAHRILVLEEGRIAEVGSHSDLLENDAIYARLMAGQLETEVRERGPDSDPGLVSKGAGALAGERAGVRPISTEPIVGIGTPPVSWTRLLWRLLDLVSPWRGKLVATFVCGVLRVFTLVGMGVISALVVRQVAEGGDFSGLLVVLSVLVLLVPLLHWAESWVAHDVAFRLLSEMRNDLYAKLDPLAPAYLLRRRTGDVVAVVTSDVETVEYFFAHTVAPAFVAITVPAAVLATLAAFQWPLAIVLLPFLGFVAYTPILAGRSLGRLAGETRRQQGEISAHMVDSVQGMREILAFGREETRLQEVVENQRRYTAYRLRFWRHLTAQRAIIEAAIGLGGLSVLALGTYFVSLGSLSGTMLPLLSLIALASFIPVSEVAQVAKQLADTFASARRVFTIHDEPVVVRDGSGRGDRRANGRGAVVRFEGVTFAYAPDLPPALQDISFSIASGQTVAVVGRSGAGKTTAAHLLMRFWDPREGRITFDGYDLRGFALDDLRQSIALVAQDTYLFNTTVRDNLKLAKPAATDEEVVAAAREANAHDFIMAMPDGYDTRVGERGVHLSGGQRQRIAIARAVLKNAPVLILDEATSHLDAENEQDVRSALSRLRRGRTTLVIGHRLSTVRDADRIVVLDHGRVVEEGTHRELLARGGLYAYLVSAQMVAAAPTP